MSIMPVGGWSDSKKNDITEQKVCPNCQSSEWKSANLVYMEGLSASLLRSHGTSVGIGRIGAKNGRFALGGAASNSTFLGVSQSALSKIASPPRKKLGFQIFLVLLIFILGLLFIFNILAGYSGVAVVIAVCAFLLFIALMNARASQETKYDEALAEYQETRMCLRCGTFYRS